MNVKKEARKEMKKGDREKRRWTNNKKNPFRIDIKKGMSIGA